MHTDDETVPAGRDAARTRARIVAAARQEFATQGFRGATMRSIATAAGVDVALLPHYFGNKDGLFAATVDLPAGAAQAVADVLSGPRPTQGARLARAYLGLWEDPATGEQMVALARVAIGSAQGTDRLRDILGVTIAGPGVARAIEGRRQGFLLAMTHLVGLAVVRYVARVPPVSSFDLEVLVERVAPAVQLHLDTPDAP
ncbi:TetR family transcriptional regulator [Sediminihabitans luteus]|uniref:TetR family transcriptional regulator n=1 Tax=Sediminihabitans luteus TaxID=1138585 RepID=A0A2M9CZW9_9CELL|nr:TetR family transcriptional regulator [Sediminihabitans luteus]PJJ77449.1 TetR family transcriptional regulator [Sediminihabitans luteus]GII98342.1 TetR family transcriptional regulator [Sediminihabitans luteus]